MENETAILLNKASFLMQDVCLLVEKECWSEIETPYIKLGELLERLLSNKANLQDEKVVGKLSELLGLHKFVSNSVEQAYSKVTSNLCDLKRAKQARESYQYTW